MKTFASDNAAEVHPRIMDAIIEANKGHALAYGRDEYTERAVAKFREHFGPETGVYFVFGGTGANIVGIKAAIRTPYPIVCAESAHIYKSERGAPQQFTGSGFVPVRTQDGKLRVDDIAESDRYHGIISISQPTELGTVYEPEEIALLSDYAHGRGIALHMDGARICNAAAYLGTGFNAFTKDVGVDVLSFGGTKNGMMDGEAVVLLNPALCAEYREAKEFDKIRVQAAQRPSKMRYIAAQFDAILSNNLWLENARHANEMAKLLYNEVHKNPAVTVTQPVQSNAVFATIPREYIGPLQERYYFHVWDETMGEVRWMCAWDTTEEDVMDFSRFVRDTVK